MMPTRSIADALLDLARRPDPLVSALAAALVPAAADPFDESEVSQKEIKERLFALISRRIATADDPTAVVKVLRFIDEYIADQTGHLGPFARRFASTASALTTHLESATAYEQLEKQIAEDTPIERAEKNVLSASPAAPMGHLGAELLCDRILGAVLRQKPAKVRLCMPRQPPGAANPSEVFAALRSDLTEQGIAFELVQEATPIPPVDHSAKVN